MTKQANVSPCTILFWLRRTLYTRIDTTKCYGVYTQPLSSSCLVNGHNHVGMVAADALVLLCFYEQCNQRQSWWRRHNYHYWYFISKKCTYICIWQHIQTTKKFHVYPKIYVPLGDRQRNYSEFIKAGSLQVEFNMVRTWTIYNKVQN